MKKFLIIVFIALTLILTAADTPKYYCQLQSWRAFEGKQNMSFVGTYYCNYWSGGAADPQSFTTTQTVKLPLGFYSAYLK